MLAKWHITITDLEGNVIPNATVYVVNESNGGMPSLYADRDGTVDIGNPVSADDTGFCSFHVVGGAYAITARKGGFERTWRYVGIGTAQEYDVGALGNAVGWDAVVDSVTDLPSGVAAGYRVVVLDTDDGRAGVYEWSGSSWLGPIYITGSEGLPGVPNTLTIGSVEEGPAAAEIVGQSPNQVLNLSIPKGDTGDITPELEQLRQDTLDARDAAEASASSAEDSAQAAATSETNAATSATNAADSEGNAAQSASDAADSAAAALASEQSAAADALIAAAAVREGYGIKLYYSEGVPAGGWFADRYVAADSLQSLLYAEIIDGDEDAELGVTVLVNGASVYGPVTATMGMPLINDGLSISVGEGDAVDFMLTPTPDAVRRVVVKTQGRLV